MDVESRHLDEANRLTRECFAAAMLYQAQHAPELSNNLVAWTDFVSSYAGIMSATLSHIVVGDEDKESWED